MRRLRSFNCLLLLLHACLSSSASLLSTGAVPIPSTWPYGASNAITWKKKTTQTLVFRPLSHWRHYKLPLTQYYQPVEMFLFLFGPFKRNENRLYFFCLVSFLFSIVVDESMGTTQFGLCWCVGCERDLRGGSNTIDMLRLKQRKSFPFFPPYCS
jgi:hypothetical protein